jgi:hypothetical protein
MVLFLCVTGYSLFLVIFMTICFAQLSALILVHSLTSRVKPVFCNLPECIYVSIFKIPKCIVFLILCVFAKCICFRSHKTLQQMIILDGDDAGWKKNKRRRESGASDTEASRERQIKTIKHFFCFSFLLKFSLIPSKPIKPAFQIDHVLALTYVCYLFLSV